jgi:threonine dehydrogenase-like Zn-dependent dehydrogenase
MWAGEPNETVYVVAEIKRLTEGRGADVAIEAQAGEQDGGRSRMIGIVANN